MAQINTKSFSDTISHIYIRERRPQEDMGFSFQDTYNKEAAHKEGPIDAFWGTQFMVGPSVSSCYTFHVMADML